VILVRKRINHALTQEERLKGLARKRVYTIAETQEQEAFVFNGIISGQLDRYIFRAFHHKFGCNRGRYNTLHARMMQVLAEDHTEKLKTAKVEAIQRIKRDLAQLRVERQNMAQPDTKAIARHSAEILKYEQFLADLTGAREPIKVEMNVQIRESLTAVIANMTPEMMNERLQRVREDRRLAEIARAWVPGVVDELQAAE